MPPRTRADHLTEEQLGELSNALAEGRRATVYLIDGIPSLGIEPGASARVVSVSGTTVMVRPKGVDDELPFESDELRLTRQPAGAPAKKTAATKSAPAKAAASTSPAVTPSAGRPAATKPAAPQPGAAGPAAA
ncbi:MAG: translation initiation factor, partial [Rhodococcus sp. (in: high G+C Gram-positive bacteria)]